MKVHTAKAERLNARLRALRKQSLEAATATGLTDVLAGAKRASQSGAGLILGLEAFLRGQYAFASGAFAQHCYERVQTLPIEIRFDAWMAREEAKL